MCADDCGVTPLLVAAVNDHLSICRLLINSNCRIDVVGDIKLNGVQRQLTPLQGAILRGNYEVARLLVFAGASVTSEKYLFSPEATIPQHLLEEDGLGLVILHKCCVWRCLGFHVSNAFTLPEYGVMLYPLHDFD
jgi:hypothetical protein